MDGDWGRALTPPLRPHPAAAEGRREQGTVSVDALGVLNLMKVCGADVEGVVVDARFTSGRRARQRPPKQQQQVAQSP